MGQEESPLALIEIASSSKYELESEASTSFSPLSLYISSPPTPSVIIQRP